ncbi:MAG TPA: cytochrome P450 [Pseudomonadales bacterium]|nr:cytochrome P450 [Pseudomonadales bacterium]
MREEADGRRANVGGDLPSIRFTPPGPRPLSPVVALARTALAGEGDLLSLLPADAYRVPIGPLGYSRRQILVVNDPALVRTVLDDEEGIFPKNDLMTGALAPLVGNAMFVSSGDTWRRQRAMVDPAFSHMRINRAFASMASAVDAYEAHLDGLAGRSESLDIDAAMSHLTADVICRTIFSTELATDASRDVFRAFELFEKRIAHVDLLRLIFGRAFADVPHDEDVLEACRTIRRRLGEFVDPRLAGEVAHDDICGAVIAARDADTGAAFDREELIDQLGVFFLAGHETTASVLTWVMTLLTCYPQLAEAMRAEVDAVVGDGAVTFEHTKHLPFVRAVFRETARLYPPITFIPRVATRATRLGGRRVRRGAMVMISPWTIHRHELLWDRPNEFDPSRFLASADGGVAASSYIPFGHGPRLCVGAAFATIESCLILARLVRRYHFERTDDAEIRPVARLTTRPRDEVRLRVTRRR